MYRDPHFHTEILKRHPLNKEFLLPEFLFQTFVLKECSKMFMKVFTATFVIQQFGKYAYVRSLDTYYKHRTGSGKIHTEFLAVGHLGR